MAVLGTLGRAPVELIGQVAGVPGGPVVPGGPFAKPPGSVTLLALAPGEEWVVADATAAITAQYATDPAGPWGALSADVLSVALDGSGVKRSAGVPMLAGAKGDIYVRVVHGTDVLSASRSAYDTRGYSHARLVVDSTHAGAVSLVEVQLLDTVAPATPDVPPAPCEGDEGCSWSDEIYEGLSESYDGYADADDFESTVNGGADPRYSFTYGDGWSLTDGTPGTTYNCQPVVRSTRNEGYGWWTDVLTPRNDLAVRQAVRFPADWFQPDYEGPGFGTGFLTLAEFYGDAPFPEIGGGSVGLGLAGNGLYLWTHVSDGDYEFTKVAEKSALVTGAWREFRLRAWVTQASEEVGQLHASVQWGAPCALVNSASAPARWVNPRAEFISCDRFNHTYATDSHGDQVFYVGPWRIIPGNWIGGL